MEWIVQRCNEHAYKYMDFVDPLGSSHACKPPPKLSGGQRSSFRQGSFALTPIIHKIKKDMVPFASPATDLEPSTYAHIERDSSRSDIIKSFVVVRYIRQSRTFFCLIPKAKLISINKGGETKIVIGTNIANTWRTCPGTAAACSSPTNSTTSTATSSHSASLLKSLRNLVAKRTSFTLQRFSNKAKEEITSKQEEEEENFNFELDDSRCPICFHVIEKCGEVDQCTHRYCLPCLMRWSEKSNWCPICRQTFAQVFVSTWRYSDTHKPYKRYPMRCVFSTVELRDYLNANLPTLELQPYCIKYNRTKIVLL